MSFAKTLAISLGVLLLSQEVESLYQGGGLGSGYLLPLLLLWLIFLLPWSLAIYLIWHWRRWSRYRTAWILAPALFLAVAQIGSLIFDPPSPQKRLYKTTGAHLPSSMTGLQTSFAGGGLADYRDHYVFYCSAEDLTILIHQLKLSPSEVSPAMRQFFPDRDKKKLPDWREWSGIKYYNGNGENQRWHYHLITRETDTGTQAYLMIHCI